EGIVYKGENKEGFIVFDPIDPEENEVQLQIRDFVLEYDENNWPSKMIDLSFFFKREVEGKRASQ
ncbi:MAG: hypothetical protein ACE5QV_05655, partial [Fidelibacterota bacterium]